MNDKQKFALRKGRDLPITGAPEQQIHLAPDTTHAAVLGSDILGLKPGMLVQEGDVVQKGTPLFRHKETPDVLVVAPVAGRVSAINRGARRVLQSVVIERDGDDAVDFSEIGSEETADGLVEKLCAAGLWPAFRTRPYSKVADPKSRPSAIFVTAMDSEPLAGDAQVIIADQADAFKRGLAAVTKLTEGKTYLCHETGADISGAELNAVTVAEFSGPHPSGLAGTHIHFLHPIAGEDVVWTIGYHDVIAIGQLLIDGKISSERVIAITGPAAKNPRLVRMTVGAQLSTMLAGEISIEDPVRVISGSILSGKAAEGPEDYLSRYARQVCVIKEDREQIFFGWIRPMASKFAIQPVLGSAFSKKIYALSSNLNGQRRAMVPTGTFEELMPQDYLPTQLLRALLIKDTDTAQILGGLELDEEDLGLATFACPAKYEYGMALRECLAKIEKEG